MTEHKKGFTYAVSREQIDEYRKWSPDQSVEMAFSGKQDEKTPSQKDN